MTEKAPLPAPKSVCNPLKLEISTFLRQKTLDFMSNAIPCTIQSNHYFMFWQIWCLKLWKQHSLCNRRYSLYRLLTQPILSLHQLLCGADSQSVRNFFLNIVEAEFSSSVYEAKQRTALKYPPGEFEIVGLCLIKQSGLSDGDPL